MNRDQFIRAIDRAQLGALADEGEPIGDCLVVISRAWRGRDEDIVLHRDVAEGVYSALGELNRHYDDNGYEIDASAAHHATQVLCHVLDGVAEHLDRVSIVRDIDEESAA